jgi:hypothetical protein
VFVYILLSLSVDFFSFITQQFTFTESTESSSNSAQSKLRKATFHTASTSTNPGMTLTYRNGVSIAEIIVYVPILAIAILLSIRHGFSRSAGWW